METKKKQAKVYKSKVLEDFFTVKDTKEYKRTENNMLLALRIEKAVEARGWNRTRFAKEMNVESSVITKWLSGTHNFTCNTLFDIEDVLKICLVNTKEPHNTQTILNTFEIKIVTPKQSFQPHSYYLNGGNFMSLSNTTKLHYGES